MSYRSLILASPVFVLTVFALTAFVLTAQRPGAQEGIFTVAQAEAGRVAYENTCGQCHTPTLMGRNGRAPGRSGEELPPLASLSAAYREFIGPKGYVRPLAGPEFVSRFGSKTAAELIARFQETVAAFPPAGMDDETTVNITAYVLQVNGAPAGTQRLTRSTPAIVGSLLH